MLIFVGLQGDLTNIIQVLKLGEKIIQLDEVNSTNIFAKELISMIKPIIEGTIVLADHQYKGKGRNNKTWISEKGKNISMSIILFPGYLNSTNIFYLSKSTALGVRDYLKSLGLDNVKIKWPNDIYVENEKIAGILIENTWKGDKIQESIVGIGLNVNQSNFLGLDRNVTSLRNLRKKEFKLDAVLKELIQFLENRLSQLNKMNFGLIDDDYRRALFGRKLPIKMMVEGEMVEARVADVAPSGEIVLEMDGKERRVFDIDQVKIIHTP